MYTLDTNVCIRLLRNRSPRLRTRFVQTDPAQIVLSTIVQAELYDGAYRSVDPEANLNLLAEFFRELSVIAFDEASARIYGKLKASLARQNRLIGPNDLLIASIALAQNLILVTSNLREFNRVPDLKYEDWEA